MASPSATAAATRPTLRSETLALHAGQASAHPVGSAR
jgi:hypothetical protein